MNTYTLNCLSNDRIYRVETLHAADRAEALQRAEAMRGRAPAELWLENRFIARLITLDAERMR